MFANLYAELNFFSLATFLPVSGQTKNKINILEKKNSSASRKWRHVDGSFMNHSLCYKSDNWSSYVRMIWLIRVPDPKKQKAQRKESWMSFTKWVFYESNSFIWLSWLILMIVITHSYMCHVSFICVSWLIQNGGMLAYKRSSNRIGIYAMTIIGCYTTNTIKLLFVSHFNFLGCVTKNTLKLIVMRLWAPPYPSLPYPLSILSCVPTLFHPYSPT